MPTDEEDALRRELVAATSWRHLSLLHGSYVLAAAVGVIIGMAIRGWHRLMTIDTAIMLSCGFTAATIFYLMRAIRWRRRARTSADAARTLNDLLMSQMANVRFGSIVDVVGLCTIAITALTRHFFAFGHPLILVGLAVLFVVDLIYRGRRLAYLRNRLA